MYFFGNGHKLIESFAHFQGNGAYVLVIQNREVAEHDCLLQRPIHIVPWLAFQLPVDIVLADLVILLNHIVDPHNSSIEVPPLRTDVEYLHGEILIVVAEP